MASQPTQFDYTVTETGPRNVATLVYRGRRIEVATGYDAISDKWPVHVYVDGAKAQGMAARSDSMREAFIFGFSWAMEAIETRSI